MDSLIKPAWIERLIENILKADFCKIELVIVLDSKNGLSKSPDDRFTPPYLFRLLFKIERLFKKLSWDALNPKDLYGILSENSIPIITAPYDNNFVDISDESISTICEYHLDVLISLAGRLRFKQNRSLSRHGLWIMDPEMSSPRIHNALAFWDIIQGRPFTELKIKECNDPPLSDKMVNSVAVPTHPWSIPFHLNEILWSSSALMAQAVRLLHNKEVSYVNGETANVVMSCRDSDQHVPVPESDFGILKPGLKLAQRFARHAVNRYWFRDQWFLGYQIGPPQSLLTENHNLNLLIPPQDRFWADPFPMKFRDNYFIFVEEFMYGQSKGHISVIELDPAGKFKSSIKVLDREYHLSYPFLLKWAGELFMIPETAQNKAVELYRCRHFPGEWEQVQILLEGFSAVDPTMLHIDDRCWLFLSTKPFGTNLDTYPELRLFYADKPTGPWHSHARNPVKLGISGGRSAGSFFIMDGKICRPAQDSSLRYGYGIAIQQILTLDRNIYSERQVACIGPNWAPGLLGTHHLASYGDFVVIDGVRRLSQPGIFGAHPVFAYV